ncbi:MAG TPA: imidazolonepropionase [Terriglobales bacterium]|jgi:imidazolonepropionase
MNRADAAKRNLKASVKTNSGRPILLRNIGQLLTLASARSDSQPRRGNELSELGIIEDGAVLCSGGRIASVGHTRQALRDPWIKKNRNKILEIDCSGKVVLPGFIDSHTHPAFVGPRLVDFEKRISGATYEEIAEAGGGIRSSSAAVRMEGKADLARIIRSRLGEMLASGTTTVEAKSGYGLSLEAELKSLEAIRIAARTWPGTAVPTLLGAHVVPSEFEDRPSEYVRIVCEEMIPKAGKRGLAEFVDVFCDRGAFSEGDTLRIFVAAQKSGLRLRAHVSQFSRTSLAKLLSLQPVSLDHLDRVDESDIFHIARSGTVATLVPGANFFLGTKDYPPARKLIDSGVAVALATDFNPGSSPTLSMGFVLSLACTHMKMSPAESISAATVNAACALGLQKSKGSIELGKDADIAIFDVPNYREIPYWLAGNKCERLIVNGELIKLRKFDDLIDTQCLCSAFSARL